MLLARISAIKVFDPACGSGNFLVIAYKELRRLEHAILERLSEIDSKHQVLFAESVINIENFYGIEIDDFAAEVAILSLWIAKHQMNREFFAKFRVDLPLIPLKETGRIHHGNATRIDWQQVCPNDRHEEIYLIGNPPYKGGKSQGKEMKSDYPFVLGKRPHSKDLDYIALWFVKGAEYIAGTKAELSFVTTNSVAQGEHVGLMFPMIFAQNLEIGYAYTSFKWENNAKRNAGVMVAVINLRTVRPGTKYIYTDGLQIEALNINGYLADSSNISMKRRSKPLSSLPTMALGSVPKDDGALVLDPPELADLVKSAPDASTYVKRFMGSVELINDRDRFCLWVSKEEFASAETEPALKRRFDHVRDFRSKSSSSNTSALASSPFRFWHIAFRETESIIVPRVSSVRRDYIPMGYLGTDTVVSDAAYAVYDAEPWVFALLTSRMHMAWTRAIGGRMKMDYRYSNTIVYNNFPVPPLPEAVKEHLTSAALRVLDVREYHCEKTLAELYDPDLMPADLRLAHAEIDALVDSIYSKRGYELDEQRLSDLFRMYEAMIADENSKGDKKR